MSDTSSHTDADEQISRWGVIFHGTGLYKTGHTRQQWLWIADAVGVADRVTTDTAYGLRPGQAFTRGDPHWCELAANTYRLLENANAYRHLAPGETPECVADERAIRSWLNAPWVPAGAEPRTMLQANRLDEVFDPQHPPGPTAAILLVDHAQQLGVFGVPGHSVGLWRWIEQGEYRDGFMVTVREWGEPGLASGRIDADEFLQSGAEPVDAIVGVLQGAARVANQLLVNREPTAAAPPAPNQRHGRGDLGAATPPTGARERAFTPPRLDTSANPLPRPPAASPPGGSARHR